MVGQRQGLVGRHVHVPTSVVRDLDNDGINRPECHELRMIPPYVSRDVRPRPVGAFFFFLSPSSSPPDESIGRLRRSVLRVYPF